MYNWGVPSSLLPQTQSWKSMNAASSSHFRHKINSNLLERGATCYCHVPDGDFPCRHQLQFLNAWQQLCSCQQVTIWQLSTSKLKGGGWRLGDGKSLFSVFYIAALETRLYFLRKTSGTWQQLHNNSYI